MTIDEALQIIETALNHQNLTQVQELILRKVWDGLSYKEIAKTNQYEYYYIKKSAYELWQLLSESFGEKVKKKNLEEVFKRYSDKSNMKVNRNQIIEINLTGANFTGASLSVANLITKSTDADLLQMDLQDIKLTNNYGNQENITESNNYNWDEWCFNSDAEVKIAQIFDNLGLLFLPQSKLRITTNEQKQNLPCAFLVCYQSKWGILQILDTNNTPSDRAFNIPDIYIIKYYDNKRCCQEPELVVRDFLSHFDN